MPTWRSDVYSGRERVEALRETIRHQVVDVDLELPARPDDVHATVGMETVGSVQVCSVQAMPTVVRRRPKVAQAESAPSLFVTLQLESVSMMVQHGREAVLRPGELAVYATTTPYSLIFDRGVHAHFIRFPLDRVGLPMSLIDEVSARPLGLQDGVSALAWQFLRGFADLALAGADVTPLALAATDLLRTALTMRMPQTALHRRLGDDTLLIRIEAFIDARLDDALLSAGEIAAAHHISVRQLYIILARAGISLGDHLRDKRLAGTRSDLANPHLRHISIAAVARRRGFTNASHFSREFRDAFGLSPREWRASSNEQTDSSPAP